MQNSTSVPLLKDTELGNWTWREGFHVLQIPASHALLASPWLSASRVAAGPAVSTQMHAGTLRLPEPQTPGKELELVPLWQPGEQSLF